MSAPLPNILLVMADQLTAFALSAYGGRLTTTPVMDALAARGHVFDAAYCPYPLCAPSRFATMAGRLPSRIAAYDNGAEFPASVPTFAHYLRRAGYFTAISGKMHFVGPDQLHGFEDRLTTEIYPADFSWTPDPDEVASAERFGAGTSTVENILDSGPMARTMQIDYDEDVAHHTCREIFVRARTDDPRPFFITASFTQPHDPYVTTQRYWDAAGEAPPPTVPFVPLDQRDPHSRMLFDHYGQDTVTLGEAAIARARRAYAGMTRHIDDLLGAMVAALTEAGLLDNTLIIVASDHGDMLGERGMWYKKTLFEPAIRVPLIVAGPGVSAGRTATPVSLLDLMPTLCDLAGATPTTPMDGRSLAPALRGDALPPVPIFVEHLDGGTAAPRVMVRDGDKKLILSEAYPPIFTDLAADLLELTLSQTPDPHLTWIAAETWDLAALQAEKIANQRARSVVRDALKQGRQTPWATLAHAGERRLHTVRAGDRFPDVERAGYLRYRP
ncbi:MAG: choline-sulfatase [Pseudomonadota bacterium]